MHLALAVTALSVIVTGLSILIVERRVSDRMEATIGSNLAELAHQTTSRLDRSMYERLREIQLAARRIGKITRREDIQREIDDLQTSYGYYAWIGMTDLQGRITHGSGGLLAGADVSKRSWYTGALQGTHLFDVHDALMLHDATGKPGSLPPRVFDIAFPVHDATGVLLGVLAAHVTWEWARDVRQAIFRNQKDAGAELLILSASGRILLGPSSHEGEQLTTAASVAAGRGITSYLRERWPDEGDYLVGFSRSNGHRESPGLGWRILVRQDYEEALAPVRDVQRSLAGWGVAIALGFSVLGWFGAGIITRPLFLLAKEAGSLATDKPMTLSDGGYREVHMLRTAIDTGGRRLQESAAALAASELQLQGILKTAMDAIITVDDRQRIVMFNDAAQRLFGLSRDEALEQPLVGLMPEAARSRHGTYVQQFGDRGGTTRAMGSGRVVYGRRSDGTEFPLEASISAYQAEDGRRLYTVIMRDISERMHDREALLRSNAQLQEFSDRFDRTLLSQLEEQMARIAQELHDSLGSSLAGVSLLLASARQMPEEADGLLERAGEQVRAAAESTRQLARGVMPVGTHTGALLQALEQFAQTISVSRLADLQVHASTSLDAIDPVTGNHVYRIIQEAVNNALRHGRADVIQVSFEDEGGRYLVRVTDNGMGFDLQRLAVTESGVGVKSMQARARAVGAEIGWTSSPGEGVIVTLDWPR